jgi:hypothetical protein
MARVGRAVKYSYDSSAQRNFISELYTKVVRGKDKGKGRCL